MATGSGYNITNDMLSITHATEQLLEVSIIWLLSQTSFIGGKQNNIQYIIFFPPILWKVLFCGNVVKGEKSFEN